MKISFHLLVIFFQLVSRIVYRNSFMCVEPCVLWCLGYFPPKWNLISWLTLFQGQILGEDGRYKTNHFGRNLSVFFVKLENGISVSPEVREFFVNRTLLKVWNVNDFSNFSFGMIWLFRVLILGLNKTLFLRLCSVC